MIKIFKTAIGILLLPFCVGAAIALYHALLALGSPAQASLSILAGGAIWVAIYVFLPKPRRIYVFGHELTHALSTRLFGGKSEGMRVAADGGHVFVTKSNFLVSLSPYFFPIYAVIIIAVFAVGNFFWDLSPYSLIFYVLIGMAYAFHVTMTLFVLKSEQSDIRQESYVFSAVVIFLGNVLVLLVAIPLLSPEVSIMDTLGKWIDNSLDLYGNIFYYFR